VIREINEERFEPGGWLHAEPVAGTQGSAGRGSTLFVGNVPRQFVLRHFVRGGLVSKLVHDKYVWTGEEATRSFAEWRLLAKMAARGLRVPRPAAARYVRHGLFYTADIITVRIPKVRPLSELLAARRLDADTWQSLGAAVLRQPGPWRQQTLRRLHRSLEKIRSQNPSLYFSATDWEQFLEGYFSAARSA
jgi:3-deoxy-D-manno-octulosonic acid kinase